MQEHDLRRDIIKTARAMNAQGINQGTSGNISARVEGGFLITPSGIDYEACAADDIIRMTMDGAADGPHKPSTEWRMHRDLLAARPEAQAVLHAHPTYSTVLACMRRPIPPFHYMVAIAGGMDIRCAAYANFGTKELSSAMLEAMQGRTACPLANHGTITVAGNLKGLLTRAAEIETLARQYCQTLQIGEPVLLTDVEMDEALEKFSTYTRGLNDPGGDIE